jgi:SAM-dependent methyltransferase/glycosyltransferase involved in cell wall biosynthesis
MAELPFSGERFVATLDWADIAYEHWHRYLIAADLVAGKRVLDVASGDGYGSDLLAGRAAEVVGVDVSAEAVAFATERYPRPNLRFLQGSCGRIPVEGSARFDAVVSFETIEHVDVDEQQRFLAEAKRLLVPGGLLVVSTPDKLTYSDLPNYRNPFHVHEFYRNEFESFLRSRFQNVRFLAQRVYASSYVWAEGGPEQARVEYALERGPAGYHPASGRAKAARYLVALCSDGELPAVGGSVLLDLDDGLLRQADERARGALEHVREEARERAQGEVREQVKGEALEQVRRVDEQLWAANEQTRAANAQLQVANEQTRAVNAQLQAANEQLQAASALASRQKGELAEVHAALEELRSSPAYRATRSLLRVPGRLRHAGFVALQVLYWTGTFQLRAGLRRRKYARLIRRARVFQPDFYLAQCPPDASARRDPIAHYLLRGAKAGLDPNPFFDTSFYTARYPDAAAKNPLVHYLRYGAKEGRATSARFDTAYYLAHNPDVSRSGLNPLTHYLETGIHEGRAAHPPEPRRPTPSDPQKPAPSDPLTDAAAFADPAQARRILVVDRRVLTPDQDSGSVRMFAVLSLLRRLGHPVTFATDSAERLERQEEAIGRLGVDVLLGRQATLAHLATSGHEYGFALLSRPETARDYLMAVRALALRAKVVYDTVDLHWVRFQRASEVTGDRGAALEAERFRGLERANVVCSDVTLTVTPQEREILMREVPEARVEVLPNIHRCLASTRPWATRRDLMFLGGYEHVPNVDAVEWFVERILPRVRRALPEVVFQVVGSKVPDRLRRLESQAVRIVGYVADLGPLFESSRVFVSPLRYGAGMKGKIGQSMSHGLPVVTTSVGAEGMMLVDGENAMVADDPDAFADAVVRVYSEEPIWSRLARASVAHVQAHFSDDVVLRQLRSIFGEAVPPGELPGAKRTET